MSRDCFAEIPPITQEEELLEQLYAALGLPLDDLPYTEEFEHLYQEFTEQFPEHDRRWVLNRLFRLRKAGLLPRFGRVGSIPMSASADDVELIERLVIRHAGSLGRRDQLPYTDQFAALVREFNEARSGPPLSEHAIWRLVARVSR